METLYEDKYSFTIDYLFVPPSGGSLEIGNAIKATGPLTIKRSRVPPSGGSLEIGNMRAGVDTERVVKGSPFGGIPRNWKL